MIQIKDLYWAAGFLEGEGGFGMYGPKNAWSVQAAQVQKEPLERLKSLFGGSITYESKRKPTIYNRQPCS